LELGERTNLLRKTVSGILFVLLLVSVFAGAFNVQSARVNASSRGETVQAADTDWWPMFHHDLGHTGTSTSAGPTTNNTLWTYTTGGSVDSSPAVAGGVVYVCSQDGEVYALNAATGTRIWTSAIGRTVSSPAVVDGVVYVGSMLNGFFALNATTGTQIWTYATGLGWNFGCPAVVDGVVYVGSGNVRVGGGIFYALNATTGALVWSVATGGEVYCSPAVAGGGGVVIADSLDAMVTAFNATTGEVVWSCPNAGYISSPAVVDGVVYVGSWWANLMELNATTGTVIWGYTTGYSVMSSPAVAGGVVYVGSCDGNVYALDTANLLYPIWNYTTGISVPPYWTSAVESSPAVAGGVVYVGSDNGEFYALNAVTGELIWSYKTGGRVFSSPAVAGGVVYVGSSDGKVYAFGVGVHDVAVTNAASSKTVVGQGYDINVTVTLANQGGCPETFNVTFYANETIIGTLENVTLASGDFTTLTFTWNTTGFAKGNYTIWAYAWPVQDETDTADNTCYSTASVHVGTTSDINGDFKVDIKDLVLVIKYFGSYPGHPTKPWNPNADINSDNKIDIKDLVLVIKHFGEHYP